MVSRLKVTSAKFVGVKNGRPRFDYDDGTAPPDWLVKLANKGSVAGDKFMVGGKELKPGQVVTGDDNG